MFTESMEGPALGLETTHSGAMHKPSNPMSPVSKDPLLPPVGTSTSVPSLIWMLNKGL